VSTVPFQHLPFRAAPRGMPAHPLLRLAWSAIREYIDGGDPRQLLEMLVEFGPPQACFVSLKMGGKLRGCIGSLRPAYPTREAEIVANAVASSQRDPRFAPVARHELDLLQISIDLLSPPEDIRSAGELNPRRYGVIVQSGGRSGVLLPDLPGVDTPDRQIAICREKADIPANAAVTLQRFTVQRIGV
jgi:AmmeMemoRadiSam system protein A